MRSMLFSVATVALLGVVGCGATAPTSQTVQTAHRVTRMSLDLGSCITAAVQAKMEPQATTAAIAGCVEDAVRRDLAEQAALAEALASAESTAPDGE